MTTISEVAESLGARDAANEFRYLPLTAIVASKTNPRKTFDAHAISELAKSISEVGVIEPLIVRPRGENSFELIAGERRWRAAKEAQLEKVPVIVRPLSDQEVLEVQVIENLQRRDLHPLEEADGYRQLLATKKYDAARIAERIGMSVKYVYDRIKLGDLIPEAKKLFRDDRMAAGHAILLARLAPEDQKRAIKPTEFALFDYDRGIDFGEQEKEERFKARSVREFDGWIAEHVRFDPARDADQMVFPETAALLQEAAADNLKVVAITHEYRCPDAARSDERTYGSENWKRADGKDKKSQACEHAVLGVIVAGRDRGQSFDVCVAKEKCKTHWAAWQKEREKRATSSGNGSAKQASNDYYERQRKAQEKEQREHDAFRARFKKASPAIAKAFAAAVRKAPANAKGPLGQFLIEKICHHAPSRKGAGDIVPPGKTADDLVRYLVFLDLYGDITDEWGGPREIPRMSKLFGVDLKKILDEHAPAAPVARCKECGCTEDKACQGGCGWATSPDPKTGLGVCTKCVKKAKPAKKARAAAAATA